MDAEKVWDEAQALVAKWQPLLGLQNWLVIVDTDSEKLEESIATIHWQPFYRKALLKIFLRPDPSRWQNAAQLTGELLERHIVHELVHLLTAPIHDLMDSELNTGLLWKLFDRAEETVIDELTQVILRLHEGKH